MQRYKNKKRNASFLPIFFVLRSTFRPFSESKSRGPHRSRIQRKDSFSLVFFSLIRAFAAEI
jgi:hypothetical protein